MGEFKILPFYLKTLLNNNSQVTFFVWDNHLLLIFIPEMQVLILDTNCGTETETQKVKEEDVTPKTTSFCFRESQLQNSEGKVSRGP